MAASVQSQEIPQSLSARYEGSFAYLTVRDRLPTILTRVIDTIHRHKNQFFEEHGEEGVEAEKKAISLLSKLRNEVQTDKPILPLGDGREDTDTWNSCLQRQQDLLEAGQAPSWFKSPWLYVECYMYRRIHEALHLSPPICAFDVFREAKTQSFFESQQAVLSICNYLQSLKERTGQLSEIELLGEFLKLLQVSLWGNRCDLSISAGKENAQKSSPIDSLDQLKSFVLVDNSMAVWSVLMSAREKPRVRVDIVLDNAGFELVTDLVLADFLVSYGLAHEVHFHGKSLPWFVSDTTRWDFEWTMRQTMAANHKQTSRCGAQWLQYMKGGVWRYHEDPFWTLPYEFCDMVAEAPQLYAVLQETQLLFLKGDLNYRKLIGDRAWEHTTPFAEALRGFHPAPLCSLRTLKADLQAGLPPGRGQQLSAHEPDWMTSGKYAVVQFCSPPE